MIWNVSIADVVLFYMQQIHSGYVVNLYFQWKSGIKMSSGFGPGLILNLSSPGQSPGSVTIDFPLRARARALHAHEETTLKNRRFLPLGSAQRLI